MWGGRGDGPKGCDGGGGVREFGVSKPMGSNGGDVDDVDDVDEDDGDFEDFEDDEVVMFEVAETKLPCSILISRRGT